VPIGTRETTKSFISQREPAPPPAAELRREGRLAGIANTLAFGATITDIA
jgi:hypothetical protein